MTQSRHLFSRRNSFSQLFVSTIVSQQSISKESKSTFEFIDFSFSRNHRQARNNNVNLRFDSQSNNMSCSSFFAQLSRDDNATKRKISSRDSLSKSRLKRVRKSNLLTSTIVVFNKQRRDCHHKNRFKTSIEQILFDDDDDDDVHMMNNRTKIISNSFARSNRSHNDHSQKASINFEERNMTRSKSCEKNARKQVASEKSTSKRFDHESFESKKANSNESCNDVIRIDKQIESTRTISSFK